MFPNINEMKIYLVCGTRADRFKALYGDKTGFVLYYRRINNGHFLFNNFCRCKSRCDRINVDYDS
ncbi:IS66 family insertion sequence element accessory protein TnpB [Liquorilactobacillus vini]|uniref:IS66 family insertion sequence element accessory protein TnpB n=1 Tax=Liquorilactobacillus vini TaxID=238015 RepID=UPI0009D9F35C